MNENVPVKTGDVIFIKIFSIGRKKDGIGSYNGFVIIVHNTEINKMYKVKITNVYDKYAFGVVLEE